MAPARARLAVAGVLAATLTASLVACGPDSPTTAPPTSPGARSSTPSVTSTRSPDLTRYTSQQITWDEQTCPAEMAVITLTSSRTSCARVQAPKDYSDPSKGDITLMVSRTKAKKAAHPRVLFTNPGGPGAPAAQFSALVSELSPLGQDHDVVGIDPRGTGESTPVSCGPARSSVSDDRTLTDSARMAALQSAVKTSVDACVAKHGDYLPYITSDNTARDHDLVRRLLGAEQVDYYGVSAGTWLGARYATLFPTHVGRFVLDSNTDFTASFSSTFDQQPMAFQRRFEQQFLPWAARNDAKYHLGADVTSVKARYEQVRLAAGRGTLRPFTPNVIDGVIAQQLYSDKGFISAAKLLSLLAAAADGDQSALTDAKRAAGSRAGAQPEDNREDTTFMAVTCNDTPWSKDPASYASLANQRGGSYPLIGYGIAASPCAYWPYRAPQTEVDLSKAPPMLMVQTEVDPATSYEGALNAHQHTGAKTRLLSIDNQGNHGAVVAGRNGCVATVAYDFLTQGRLINQDSVCPAVPLPGDQLVYPVGGGLSGQRLPMSNTYPETQPGVGQQLLQLLLDLLAEATAPRHTT